MELERIAREYDQSTPWTDNDVNEKRTTPPSESKKPAMPTHAERLSTQIAFQEKRKEVQTQPNREQHSTPMTTQHPVLENKLSPIDRKPPTTRIHTQMLTPVKENVSFDDEQQSQVKRRKIEETTSAFQSTKKENDVCLSTITDIQEDDFDF